MASAELEGRPPEVAEGDWRGIRAAYEAARHEIKPVEAGKGGFKAWNPGQGWLIGFDGRGFEVKPQQGCWSWGLEMVGAAADQLDATIKDRGSRIEFQRGDGVTEWFVNDLRGLEQGWTLAQPLADSAIPLRVRGGLMASVEKERVSFGGELSYGGLKAWDAQGRTVPVWFEAGARADEFAVRFDDRGAQYPLTIDPLAQNAYVKASRTGSGDQFGYAVAASGDTAVVGAPFEDSDATGVNGDEVSNAAPDSGAAYVFVRNGSTWEQQAYVKANNTGAGDRFGWAVAIDGDRIVIGAPFEDGGGTGSTGDPNSNATTNAGAVYVLQRTAGAWGQVAYLKATAAVANLEFGESVAISGDWIVVGAPRDNALGAEAGAAFVYVPSGPSWSIQKLTAANGQAGDQFGKAVAIHNSRLVVGAPSEDSNSQSVNSGANDNSATDAGAAYVFARDGLSFTQEAYLKPLTGEAGDRFGSSVGIFGDDVIVGAPWEDSQVGGVNRPFAGGDNVATNAGAAYVFTRFGSWSQSAILKANKPNRFDNFGHQVSLSKDLIVIGSPFEDGISSGVNGDQTIDLFDHASSGAAYVFARAGEAWSQLAYLKASNSEAQDLFGFSVAVSGDTVIVGAYGESSNSRGINGDGRNNLMPQSGAVYTFDLWQTSLSRTGTAAPGVVSGLFGKADHGVMGNLGESLWQQGLTGPGAARGGNRGLFSTLAPGNASVDLVLQSGVGLNFADLPANHVVRTFSNPLLHQPDFGVYQVVLGGAGLNSKNNRLIMIDNGISTERLFRTGGAVSLLGNAAVTGWRSLFQTRAEPALQMSYQLGQSNLAGVTKAEDTGIAILRRPTSLFDSAFDSDVSSREGQPAYGGSGTFGQFGNLNAAAGSPAYHAFVVPRIPTSPGPALPTVFWRTTNGSIKQVVTAVGSNVVGAPSTTFRAFTGISATEEGILLRASLNGAPKESNEVLWMGMGAMVRKGEDAAAGGAAPDNTPGVKIARFIRYWPVDVAGKVQVVAQVQLTGTGVTGRNNQALILIQSDYTRMLLARTGDPVLGIPGATLRTLNAVDVNPVSGHYALVASLAGVPAGRNQALLTGHTQLGNNFSPLRKPQLRLQKGGYYTSFHTPRGFIRSLALKPPVSPTGAGGIGLGQVVSASGQVLVEVTLDTKAVELVNVRR